MNLIYCGGDSINERFTKIRFYACYLRAYRWVVINSFMKKAIYVVKNFPVPKVLATAYKSFCSFNAALAVQGDCYIDLYHLIEIILNEEVLKG